MSPKLLGLVLLLVCGLVLGERAARRYVARHRDLCATRHALLMLETYVSRTAEPFPRAFHSVGVTIRGSVGRLLCGISRELIDNPQLTLAQGWENVWSNIRGVHQEHLYPAYSCDDLDVLGRLFSVLGTGGRDDQISHIRLSIEALAANEESARTDLDTYPRLWRYLGVLCAAMLSLFLV